MKLHTAGPELAGIFRDRILRRGRAWPGASSACFSCIKGSGRARLPFGRGPPATYQQASKRRNRWYTLGEIPSVVEQANKGVLSKDLNDWLKQIEMLSKRLCRELFRVRPW